MEVCSDLSSSSSDVLPLLKHKYHSIHFAWLTASLLKAWQTINANLSSCFFQFKTQNLQSILKLQMNMHMVSKTQVRQLLIFTDNATPNLMKGTVHNCCADLCFCAKTSPSELSDRTLYFWSFKNFTHALSNPLYQFLY